MLCFRGFMFVPALHPNGRSWPNPVPRAVANPRFNWIWKLGHAAVWINVVGVGCKIREDTVDKKSIKSGQVDNSSSKGRRHREGNVLVANFFDQLRCTATPAINGLLGIANQQEPPVIVIRSVEFLTSTDQEHAFDPPMCLGTRLMPDHRFLSQADIATTPKTIRPSFHAPPAVKQGRQSCMPNARLNFPTGIVEFGKKLATNKYAVLAFVGPIHAPSHDLYHLHDHFGPVVRTNDERSSVLGINRVRGGTLHERVFKNRLTSLRRESTGQSSWTWLCFKTGSHLPSFFSGNSRSSSRDVKLKNLHPHRRGCEQGSCSDPASHAK